MRVSLGTILSVSIVALMSISIFPNQQAFSHYDLPSDGSPYHVTVTLKDLEFREGADSAWEDLTSGADLVVGWRVEYIGHSVSNANTVVRDNYNIVDGRHLTLDNVVLEHDECSPLSSLRIYTWGAESEQKNILTTDRLMKEIIQHPNLSTGHTEAQQRIVSLGDEFIGHQTRLIDLDSGKSAGSSGNADSSVPIDDAGLVRAFFEITLSRIPNSNACNSNAQIPLNHTSKTVVGEKNSGTNPIKQDKKIIKQGNDVSITKPQTQKTQISNDYLKSLYLISKWQESTAASLSSVNDQQKAVIEKLTADSEKTGMSKDQKAAIKSLLKKQDTDKKNISLIRDMSKKVSTEIKKIAQKQGIASSELDKISKTTQKTGKPTKIAPVNHLKQGVDDAKTNLEQAKKEQEKHDTELSSAAAQLGRILSESNNSRESSSANTGSEKPTYDADGQPFSPDETTFENMRVVFDKDGNAMFVDDSKSAKQQEQEAAEKSKQNVISLLQQALDLLLKEEQAQTSLILDTIPDPTLKDRFVQTSPTQETKPIVKPDPSKPVVKPSTEPTSSNIHLQSKHGSYVPSSNPCKDHQARILATWVLTSSANVSSGKASLMISNLDDIDSEYPLPTFLKTTVRAGVVQYEFTVTAPGNYQVGLSSIDNRVVEDSIINIRIPNLCTSVSPPPVVVEPSQQTKLPPVQTNTKPTLTIPKQITQEATSSSGATVNYNVSGQDKEDGAITPACSYPSGYVFPIGTTTVSCTVDDSNNNSISGSFTVTIRDTTPPNIPAFQPTEGVRDETGVQVFFTVTASDLVDGDVPASCNYPSGYKFPIGVTLLTCTADDSKGNHASRSLQITVTKKESGQ